MNKLLVIALAAIFQINTTTAMLERLKGLFGLQREATGSSASTSGFSPFTRGKSVAQLEADRVARWETVEKALRSYGIKEDSDNMRWAQRNLKRAQTAQQHPHTTRKYRRTASAAATKAVAKKRVEEKEKAARKKARKIRADKKKQEAKAIADKKKKAAEKRARRRA